ncbi:thioredoxin [Pseudopedobacter saltans DSM 12145]|uniref:Thioredoxin n=1 Tax=Pseudopedobacter saltans (strain ATCC 51119 / DSM 12145 / JCM 21818 / CCUG 39354 / LMG 10337 / NBRC 100064 / NCIMB 13643) TaxID=762903 RepID=F0SBH1_PSESL|nr:DsbA family protein [Pseudopedobacter saltans]ADY51617.1 thioredoxin [Pseudopedobacter saltans DSM 12145]
MSEVLEKPTIIYIYDAICGWCYGFSPVMKTIYERYKDKFDFQVLSGGMILGDRVAPISQMRDIIKGSYKRVEETTGVKFGDAFINGAVEQGTMIMSSEKPSIALSVFKTYLPEEAVLFASDLQFALNYDGLDLNEDTTYRSIIKKYNIPEEEFINKLNDEEFRQLAYYDVALSRQLQVTGYPAAFIKTQDTEFFMIAKGYADLETIELRIQNVIKEANLKF